MEPITSIAPANDLYDEVTSEKEYYEKRIYLIKQFIENEKNKLKNPKKK